MPSLLTKGPADVLDPQRDSILTKGPADVLDHATSEIAIGGKLGIDATENSPAKATTDTKTGPLSV